MARPKTFRLCLWPPIEKHCTRTKRSRNREKDFWGIYDWQAWAYFHFSSPRRVRHQKLKRQTAFKFINLQLAYQRALHRSYALERWAVWGFVPAAHHKAIVCESAGSFERKRKAAQDKTKTRFSILRVIPLFLRRNVHGAIRERQWRSLSLLPMYSETRILRRQVYPRERTCAATLRKIANNCFANWLGKRDAGVSW